ncbi:hypothetical protein DL96DRAFT_1624199, partial [Flagelloscypha sp. PMI_526]
MEMLSSGWHKNNRVEFPRNSSKPSRSVPHASRRPVLKQSSPRKATRPIRAMTRIIAMFHGIHNIIVIREKLRLFTGYTFDTKVITRILQNTFKDEFENEWDFVDLHFRIRYPKPSNPRDPMLSTDNPAWLQPPLRQRRQIGRDDEDIVVERDVGPSTSKDHRTTRRPPPSYPTFVPLKRQASISSDSSSLSSGEDEDDQLISDSEPKRLPRSTNASQSHPPFHIPRPRDPWPTTPPSSSKRIKPPLLSSTSRTKDSQSVGSHRNPICLDLVKDEDEDSREAFDPEVQAFLRRLPVDLSYLHPRLYQVNLGTAPELFYFKDEQEDKLLTLFQESLPEVSPARRMMLVKELRRQRMPAGNLNET